MTLRCRKGDMAIVLKSPYQEYIGIFVDVVHFLGDHRGKTDCWKVEPVNKDIKPSSPLGFFYSPDSYLLPIRPGDLDETEETEKELEMAK